MAEIRLNKLAKQYNIGIGTLVDFLNERGAGLELNPNAKVSDSYLPDLEKKFGDDRKAVQEAAKVDIKMKEIIEKNSRKKTEEADDYEPARETIITSTSLSSGNVVEKPASTVAQTVQEETPQTAAVEHPEVKEEVPQPVEESAAKEQEEAAPAEEPAKVEEEPAAQTAEELPSDREGHRKASPLRPRRTSLQPLQSWRSRCP